MTVTKRRFSWKMVVMVLIAFVVCLISAIGVIFSTDKGTRFFLERVLDQQKIISYQYAGGSFWKGIVLNQLSLKFDKVTIQADQANVRLGWRAIVNQEFHFVRSDIKNLQIIKHTPSDNTPFSYPELNLPVVLRFNELNADRLTIKTLTNTAILNNIQLKQALWKNTHLSFKRGKVDLYNIFIDNVQGYIDFKQKYPLEATANISIPALKSLNMKTIKAAATGSLSQIYGGVATKTPDLLTGWIIVQPMDDDVPMRGALKFNHYHLPVLTDEKLFIKKGVAAFQGNANGFDIQLTTDLKGKNVPQSQHYAKMYTDFVNMLKIEHSTSDVLSGEILASGQLNWSDVDNIKWSAEGVFDHLKVTEEFLSKDIQGFLPKTLSGKINSQGVINKGVETQNTIEFSNKEHWSVTFKYTDLDKPNLPVNLDVKWKNINRELPYITGLNSPEGQANLVLDTKKQKIDILAKVKPYAQSYVPEGQYTGQILIENDQLFIKDIHYQHQEADVKGEVHVLLPTPKQQLKWITRLNLTQFNPQLIMQDIPIQNVSGQVELTGYSKGTTQIIHANGMNLTGQVMDEWVSKDLKKEFNLETVHLTGDSTIALLFDDEKQGGNFKSYAVQYDGKFTALHQQNGSLQFKIAGTPDNIHIEQLYHNGIAGQLNAQGHVNFKQGISWNLTSTLTQFKPHYFYKPVQGELSGQIQTQGEWSDRRKYIDIGQLNLTGTLNKKPIRGMGKLSVDLSRLNQGIKQQQFNVNQLSLTYADNQIHVKGNQNTLSVVLNIPSLSQFDPSLKGQIYGGLVLNRGKRLQLYSNIKVNQLGYASLFNVHEMNLKGELPISDTVSSQLILNVNDLSMGNRKVEQAKISLIGTYLTHMLKVESDNARSKFYIQIAGGFNHKRQWLGQIQKGQFISNRMQLIQNRNTDLVFNIDQKSLVIAEHCWQNKQNQVCFDENIYASPEQASVSLMTKNVMIQDFEEFIPEDMEITGQLNGYAKASWKKGQTPYLDAQIFTRQGVIGLKGEIEEENTTLYYDELSMIAKTTPQGLLLRTDMQTPNIGVGYAKVFIQPTEKGMPMQGEVAFNDVQLQVLRPFIQDVRKMSGTLSIAGKIGGFLTEPDINAEIHLKEGVFALSSLPVDLNNIELHASVRQNTAKINGIFNSGRGIATLTGQAGWNQQPYLRLNVKGDNLLVRQAPQIMAGVNPDLSVEILPIQQRITVNGKVHVPRALITMPESTVSAVEVSPDVRIVRNHQQATLQKAKAWDIQANIALTLGNQLIFQGFNSRIPLSGKLDLTQRGSEIALRAHGAIGVTQNVKIAAYGQTLDLNRAIARFNGALINPSLDIDATKIVQGSTVGVRVLGTALSPNIQIYSDDGLSEQQALNALLTGRISDGSDTTTSTESFKSDVNNAVAAAGISMGLGGTRALTNQIGQAFGLSGLALDAEGTGDDTQVSLTGYITPDLYIRYGVGVFTPVNKLSLRYQINKRLYFEASQDLERAIDIFYNWKF